jgi:queuine tRNA-ribosyltransferase
MGFEILFSPDENGPRTGRLTTTRGTVLTPAFMPIATAGAVKAQTPAHLEQAGAQMILANTYHLFLRPGMEVIRRFGGLHRFMSWEKPILTDSGGFQIFSLKGNARVNGRGVAFKSHIDGTPFTLTPEEVVDIQNTLGSDIQMVLDYFPAHPSTREEDARALSITNAWALRARERFEDSGSPNQQFAIVQGGLHGDLRREAIDELRTREFEGYAIGGLSVGESREDFERVIDSLLPHMPESSPRYLMGSGTPGEMLFAIERGVDMFDCVLPTRNARNGTLFTSRGKLAIKNERFKLDEAPPDPDCGCYTCRHFSRAYLRHLYLSKEINAAVLNTIHNVHFYLDFTAKIRYAIEQSKFFEFKERFLSLFEEGV